MNTIMYNGKEVTIRPTTIIVDRNTPERSKQIFEVGKEDVPISVLFDVLWDKDFKRRADIFHNIKYACKNAAEYDTFTADVGNGNVLLLIGKEEMNELKEHLSTPYNEGFAPPNRSPKGGELDDIIAWASRDL